MIFDDKFFIANKIKNARKKKKYTQEELAEKLNITSKQLSRIENGDNIPSLSTFLNIIQLLNIDINDFGIQNSATMSSIQLKFQKLIYSADDTELNFYYDVITTIRNYKS